MARTKQQLDDNFDINFAVPLEKKLLASLTARGAKKVREKQLAQKKRFIVSTFKKGLNYLNQIKCLNILTKLNLNDLGKTDKVNLLHFITVINDDTTKLNKHDKNIYEKYINPYIETQAAKNEDDKNARLYAIFSVGDDYTQRYLLESYNPEKENSNTKDPTYIFKTANLTKQSLTYRKRHYHSLLTKMMHKLHITTSIPVICNELIFHANGKDNSGVTKTVAVPIKITQEMRDFYSEILRSFNIYFNRDRYCDNMVKLYESAKKQLPKNLMTQEANNLFADVLSQLHNQLSRKELKQLRKNFNKSSILRFLESFNFVTMKVDTFPEKEVPNMLGINTEELQEYLGKDNRNGDRIEQIIGGIASNNNKIFSTFQHSLNEKLANQDMPIIPYSNTIETFDDISSKNKAMIFKAMRNKVSKKDMRTMLNDGFEEIELGGDDEAASGLQEGLNYSPV